MTEALYNVAPKKVNGESASPLVESGLKLIPSVTRVFSKARPVWVYAQAYQQASQVAQPLVTVITIYKGQQKVLETAPVKSQGAGGNSVRAVPIKLEFALTKLPPGKYDCQLTVLNPAEQKAAFWRSPIAIVP
jgi:hypothetical protein